MEPVNEVIAVRYATRSTARSECFFNYASYGEPDAPMVMDYFFWILRGSGSTVLVDTGFDPQVGARRGRTCLCPPLEALARLDIAPEDVAQVVLTHLHYDHTGNVHAFPHAELLVGERELDFWTGPNASRFQFEAHVEPDDIAAIASADRDGRVRRLGEADEVGPGVSALSVGGHSPGQQILVVERPDGPVILASDALHYYEELDRDRPFEILVDLEEMYAGYEVLRELAGRPGALLVAGHDPAVLERFPPLDVETEGLAVRIA